MPSESGDVFGLYPGENLYPGTGLYPRGVWQQLRDADLSPDRVSGLSAQLAGDVSPEEFAAANPDVAPIVDLLSKRSQRTWRSDLQLLLAFVAVVLGAASFYLGAEQKELAREQTELAREQNKLAREQNELAGEQLRQAEREREPPATTRDLTDRDIERIESLVREQGATEKEAPNKQRDRD